MKDALEIRFDDAPIPLMLSFFRGHGSKNWVAVQLVDVESGKYFASTSFAKHNARLFNKMVELGVSFGGRLWRSSEQIAEFYIRATGESDTPYFIGIEFAGKRIGVIANSDDYKKLVALFEGIDE